MKERVVTVDIGCGRNNNLYLYGFGEDEPTTAIDLHRPFLRDRLSTNGLLGNLVQADGACLPVGSESVDRVFCIHTLEHVDDYYGTLDEMARVVKPGGEIIIAVPHMRFERVMGVLSEAYFSPELHQRVISGQKLKQDLESKGFTVEDCRSRRPTSAVLITMSYLLHLRILNDRKIEPYSGCLVTCGTGSPEISSRNGFSHLKTLVRKLADSNLASLIFDRVYPFETCVEARKNSTSLNLC